MAGRPSIEIMYSKNCQEVANVLKEKGFLENVKVFKPEHSSVKRLHLDFALVGNTATLTDAKRISKPGRKMYVKASEMRSSKNGYGLMVVSTSKGIMDSIKAKKKNLGGELICEVF